MSSPTIIIHLLRIILNILFFNDLCGHTISLTLKINMDDINTRPR